MAFHSKSLLHSYFSAISFVFISTYRLALVLLLSYLFLLLWFWTTFSLFLSLSVVTTQIRDCNLSRHSSELYIQRIGTQIQCASCVLLQATSCFILVTVFHICLLCFFHSMFMLDGVLHPDWKLISTSPFSFLVCTLTHTFLGQWTNCFSHSVVWFDVISFLDYNDDV